MEEGGDYYVVRKGDAVAVYGTLSDCQAQICSSVRIQIHILTPLLSKLYNTALMYRLICTLVYFSLFVGIFNMHLLFNFFCCIASKVG
jgi:hypothetical protein